jgi:oxygen-dependent protoporphyrinogen oxidase
MIRSPFLSWRGLLRAAWEPWVPARPASTHDESLRDFVVRRFGRELHDNVFEPVMGGIFTADTGRLSLDMTARRLLQLEREHGSITRALRKRHANRGSARPAGPPRGGCVALRSGMSRLVARLRELLPPDSVRTGVEARSVRTDGDGWRIVVDGEVIRSRNVILACPGYAAAPLVSWDERLSGLLDSLEYASCATVNLVYREAAFVRPLDGFGFFCGQKEREPILACNHVSVKFPGRVANGRVLLRTFIGGAHDPQVLEQSDALLTERAHGAVARLLGIRGEPLLARAYRYPRAMPQFDVGYRERRDALVERAATLPGLYPAGGVLGSIGLPDCIQSGEAAALAVTERLAAAGSAENAAAS